MHLSSSFELYLHLAGIILAAVAAVLAIYLIPLAGKARVWLLYSAALVLLVIGRAIDLVVDHGGVSLDLDTYATFSHILDVGVAGCFLGSVYFTRDLFVERNSAEKELYRQQELTAKIVETIPMRVFWKDRDLRYLGCNTLFARDAGFTRPDELVGRTDFDMGWKSQAELYRAGDRKVMDSNTPRLAYDELQTTREGTRIWLHKSKVPLRDAAHRIIGILGIYEDITERKEMDLRLLESEERFRNLAETTSDVVWQVDDHGVYTYVSPRVRDLWGYEPEEMEGKIALDFMPAAERERVAELFKNFIRRREPFSFIEHRNIHKDGRVVFIETSGVPVVRKDGTFHGYFGTDRDITERKQAEEEIRKLNEELETKVQERTQKLMEAQEDLIRNEKLAVLGQVAGSVGHELRNPLGVMSNAVYFLEAVLSEADETTREYLNIIKDEVAVSDRIVSDLLDSVRTKQPLPEAVAVREVIERIQRKLTLPPSVSVKLDIPEGLPALWVDPMQINQVFSNLIRNGVEAMLEGGVLEIRAVENRPEETITISVRDSGCGMTPEQLRKLFQPLFTTKARGIGLGLLVVKGLTEANGGRVNVVSAPGKGSTFTVVLPSGNRRQQ